MSRALMQELGAVRPGLQQADHVLIALDFDGTLAPLAARPEEAAVPPETAGILRELAALPGVSVAIASGRSILDLKRKLDLNLIYAGNHGLEIEGPGISFVHPDAAVLLETIDYACWDLEARLQTICGVTVERKGLSATVHYRLAPVDLTSWIEASVRATMRPYLSRLQVTPALLAWEIRPRVCWDKGSAVKWLLAHNAVQLRLRILTLASLPVVWPTSQWATIHMVTASNVRELRDCFSFPVTEAQCNSALLGCDRGHAETSGLIGQPRRR